MAERSVMEFEFIEKIPGLGKTPKHAANQPAFDKPKAVINPPVCCCEVVRAAQGSHYPNEYYPCKGNEYQAPGCQLEAFLGVYERDKIPYRQFILSG